MFFMLLTIVLLIWGLLTLESRIPKIKQDSSEIPIATIKEIHKWLSLLSTKKKINGSLFFNKNGEDLLNINFGYKSPQKDLIDGDTVFQLASLSKSFTAFGTMLLIKKHGLSYDDLVSKFIISFPYPDVTIRNLLNQTSSIKNNYILLAKRNNYSKDKILTIEDATKLICKYPEKGNGKPNTQFYYNNSNYVLLARIIEIISNKSFEEYMKYEVFQPLKLDNTRVWNLLSSIPLDKMNNVATGIELFLGGKIKYRKTTWLDGVAGDRSIFSSMNDLKKWSKVWDSNTLLTNEEMLEAFKQPILNDGKKSDYGFGWVIKTDSIWHNGEYFAAKSLMIKSVKNNSVLIFLDNSSNVRFDKISKELMTSLNSFS